MNQSLAETFVFVVLEYLYCLIFLSQTSLSLIVTSLILVHTLLDRFPCQVTATIPNSQWLTCFLDSFDFASDSSPSNLFILDLNPITETRASQ